MPSITDSQSQTREHLLAFLLVSFSSMTDLSGFLVFAVREANEMQCCGVSKAGIILTFSLLQQLASVISIG